MTSYPSPLLGDSVYLQRIAYPSDSIRTFCLLSASVSMISSFLSVLNVLHIAQPIAYILNIYLLIFGAVSVILEYGAGSFDRLGVIPLVHKHFFGLTTVAGRGLFYFFQGTLTLSELGLVNFLTGATLCLAGLACLASAGLLGGVTSLGSSVIGYVQSGDPPGGTSTESSVAPASSA